MALQLDELLLLNFQILHIHLSLTFEVLHVQLGHFWFDEVGVIRGNWAFVYIQHPHNGRDTLLERDELSRLLRPILCVRGT